MDIIVASLCSADIMTVFFKWLFSVNQGFCYVLVDWCRQQEVELESREVEVRGEGASVL